MRFKLSDREIEDALVKIGLPFEHSGSRINVLCPFHSDKELGSAIVYPDRGGFFKCYACKKASNVYGLAMQHLGISFKQALELVGGQDDYGSSLEDRHGKPKSAMAQEVQYSNSVTLDQINHEPLTPANYKYCTDRGITQEFADHFGLRLGLDGRYRDYMLIPIRSERLGINTFEARKLLQHETLQQYFQSADDQDSLEEFFSTFRRKHKIKFTKVDGYTRLVAGDAKQEIDDPVLLYLMRPKVLYPSHSKVEESLFDYDNLDRSQPLIVVEGTGGMGRLWTGVSKNITAIFGSTISERQYELLREFPKLLVVSDEDEAADLMIEYLEPKHPAIAVYQLGDDRAEDYAQKFLKHTPVGPITYLNRRRKLFVPGVQVSTIPFEVRRTDGTTNKPRRQPRGAQVTRTPRRQ